MLHGGEGNLVFSDGLCGLAANWGGEPAGSLASGLVSPEVEGAWAFLNSTTKRGGGLAVVFEMLRLCSLWTVALFAQ